MVQLLWKQCGNFFIKFNRELPFGSAIPFLSVYERQMQTYVHTKTSTQVTQNSHKLETTQMSIN